MLDNVKFIREVEARAPLYDVNSKGYSTKEVKTKCWCEIGDAMFDDWDELEPAEKDYRVKDLIKKWKGMRDAFVKDYKLTMAPRTSKAAKSKKKYIYYDRLLFLVPYVKGRPNASSNIDPPTAQNHDETSVEYTPDIDPLQEKPAVDSVCNERKIPTKYNKTSLFDKRGVKRKLRPKIKIEGQSVLAEKRLAVERSIASSAKQLTSILAQSLEVKKEESNSDKFGHKAFLMSFLPVLNCIPFPTAMQLRSKISEIFSNHFSQSDLI